MKFTYATDAKPVDGFTIRRGIHRGGFGEVYYAVSDAGKEVALKLLTHDLDTELRGIRQCLNLKHPNLITIFDVRTDSDGDCWVVMEYVNGSNLEEVLTAFPNGLPSREVHDWMQGIVAGVEYLHDRGLIHRDLKPANIYRENGVVKIGDVGLSKRFDGTRHQHTESIGTVYYMAPEITHGQYGPAVDVYSLGIILYELLTGRLPFNGESSGEILMKQLSAAPDLSIVPPNLRHVLARALEKDPQKRIPSARQLWNEFEQAQSPTTIPDSHFVNGTLSDASQKRSSPVDAARRDTDKSRDTGPQRVPGAQPASGTTSAVSKSRQIPVAAPYPRSHGRSEVPKKNHRGVILGLAILVAVVLFIPWQSMSWNDRGEASGLLAFYGGFLLLMLWAREQWRPVDEPATQFIHQPSPAARANADWAGRLAIAALAGGVFSLVPYFAAPGFLIMSGMIRHSDPISPPAHWTLFVTAATILGAWAVVAGAWLTEKFAWAARHPRFAYAGIGLGLASAVYGLQEYLLMLPPPQLRDDPATALFSRLGANPLLDGNMPTGFGYAVFSSGVFFWLSKRFCRMQDPRRSVRWKIWPVVVAVTVAWLWSCLFAFPQLPGMIWIAAITASAQLAAPWQPKHFSK